MKRIISLILACMLTFTAMMPSALAESIDLSKYINKGSSSGSTLAIPDLADCAPDAVTFAQEQSGIRVYLSDDVDALLDAMVQYFTVLDSHFGLTGFDTDEESSDTFFYLYVSEYTGDADLTPTYMDECPVPCYLLAAIAPQSNGSYLTAVMAVDGIEFTADMPETTTTAADTTSYTAPVLGYNGLLVMAPEEYNSDIPGVSTLSAEGNWYGYQYIDCGAEWYDNGNNEIWELLKDYVYALVDTGYFEIIEHNTDDLQEIFYLKYTGPETVRTFGAKIDDRRDAAIIVESLLGFVYVQYSLDIIVNNLEEVMEEKGYSTPGSSTGGSSGSSTPERNCAKCSGYRTVKCSTCWGTGQQNSPTTSTGKIACRGCGGRGSVTCSACGGSGKQK